MSNAARAADRCVEFRFSGLTRYQIGCLLLLYNTYIEDSELSREGPVKVLMSVIALMGVGINQKEAQRITQTFSRTRELESFKRLTFRQFLDFFSWFFSVGDNPIAANLLKLVPQELNSRDVKDEVLRAFLEAARTTGNWSREALFKDTNFLIENMNSPAPDIDNAPIDICFELTLQQLFGLSDFEYVGLDSDVATLDFFVRVEFCGQEYTTKVRPAGIIPMIGESFKFQMKIPKEGDGKRTVSFLDATWWLQNTAVKIRVYGVHFMDVRVGYHLLGCANVPLIALLSGRNQLVSFAVDVEPIMPYRPMTLFVSTLANGKNNIAIHSMPLEAIVVQKYFGQIMRLIKSGPDGRNVMNAFKEAFSKFPDREYQVFGFDEYNRMYLLTSFVLKHDNLKMIDKDSKKQDAFVRKISYVISLHSPSVFSRESPKIMQIRSLSTIEASGVEMSEMERAIYLCSLLQSNGIENSYVCVGSHHWQRYVCVLCIFDKTTTVGSTESDVRPHHIYSLEEFWQYVERMKVPSVSSRLVGLHQVKLADWVNPIFLANAPSTESDDLEFEVQTGQDKSKKDSCALEESITDSKTTMVKLIPVTGWYSNGNSLPSGFEVGSIFNQKHMYLYKGQQRDFTLWTNGKLPVNGQKDPKQFLDDETRWEHVNVNVECAYDAINWHSWLRHDHKYDLNDRICGLWEMIRVYTLQETRTTRAVKCLKLLISYLVRLIWKSCKKRFDDAEKAKSNPNRGIKEEDKKTPEKFVSGLVEFLRNSANKCLPSEEMTIYRAHFMIEQLLFGNFPTKEQSLQGDIGQREIFIALYSVCLWIRDPKTDVSKEESQKGAESIDITRLPEGRDYSSSRAHDSMFSQFDQIHNFAMKFSRVGEVEGWPAKPIFKHHENVWKRAKSICDPLQNNWESLYGDAGGSLSDWKGELVIAVWAYWSVKQWHATPGQDQNDTEMKTMMRHAMMHITYYRSTYHLGTLHTDSIVGIGKKDINDIVSALEMKKRKKKKDKEESTQPVFAVVWDAIAWSNVVPVEFEILKEIFLEVERKEKQLEEKSKTKQGLEEVQAFLGILTDMAYKEIIELSENTACDTVEKSQVAELNNEFPEDKFESEEWLDKALEKLVLEPESEKLTAKQWNQCFRTGNRRMDGVLMSFNLAKLLDVDVVIRTLEFRKPFSVLKKDDLKEFTHRSYWQADVDRLTKPNTLRLDHLRRSIIEDYMLMYVQRQLVAMEKALKRMERIDVKCEEMDGYPEMQREIERLLTLIIDEKLSGIHPTRYMFRLTKHNTGDPRIIAEELKRSGLLTSSIGAQCVYLVAQPFSYRMRAQTCWVALIFLYPVPLPIGQ